MTGDEKTFTIPGWMTPYLEVLGGRDEVERLMSGKRANTVINAPLALVQMGMEERIAILHRLHDRGMLTLPEPEGGWSFEPKWVCEVVRSGYNAGAHCTPVDPHLPDWRCDYRYELSVPANDQTAARLRLHGFQVEDPKKKEDKPA